MAEKIKEKTIQGKKGGERTKSAGGCAAVTFPFTLIFPKDASQGEQAKTLPHSSYIKPTSIAKIICKK